MSSPASDGNQQRVGGSCNAADCFVTQAIPTLSQWSLIILGLLILNISLFYIHKLKIG